VRRLLAWTTATIVIITVLQASAVHAPSRLPCTSLEICIGSLQMLAAVPPRTSQAREQAEELLAKISTFAGADAALVPLLEGTDVAAAELAGRAMRDVPQIDPAYLPEIKRGLDRGLGWLAPALGRMNSSEAAAEAVSRYLRSEHAPANQERYAVELSGARALPHIVAAVHCEVECDERRHYLLGAALRSMPASVRATAAPQLMSIAMAPDVSDQVGQGVVGMISELGRPALMVEADLVRLRVARPSWAWKIDQALVEIGSSQAGRIFAKRLADPGVVMLRDVAEAGAAAVEAGQAVIALLDDADPEVRIAAARALGFIGDVSAVPALVSKLDDPTDPRMAWVAAEALGRLKASNSLQPLRRMSTEHWYPPVRQAAALAITRIGSGETYTSRFHPENFPFEFFRYVQIGKDDGVPDCEVPVAVALAESGEVKLRAAVQALQLETLAYRQTEFEIEPPPVESGHDGKVIKRRVETVRVPAVALRVAGGWLLGSDRGEWGGELVYLGEDGQQQELLQQNVEDIFRFGDRYVAVVGLAHLSGNHGALISVEQTAAGWKASTWRILPGAPMRTYLTINGELLVSTYSGGTIVISTDGSMRMAECMKQVPDQLSARALAHARQEAEASAEEAAEAAMMAADDWP